MSEPASPGIPSRLQLGDFLRHYPPLTVELVRDRTPAGIERLVRTPGAFWSLLDFWRDMAEPRALREAREQLRSPIRRALEDAEFARVLTAFPPLTLDLVLDDPASEARFAATPGARAALFRMGFALVEALVREDALVLARYLRAWLFHQRSRWH
jgi:hypothetical protein